MNPSSDNQEVPESAEVSHIQLSHITDYISRGVGETLVAQRLMLPILCCSLPWLIIISHPKTNDYSTNIFALATYVVQIPVLLLRRPFMQPTSFEVERGASRLQSPTECSYPHLVFEYRTQFPTKMSHLVLLKVPT